MKLTKQERIAVLVIAVILILVLGVIFFVVPKFEQIGADSAALVSKQAELTAAVNRANTKEQLGQDVITAYDEGRNIADMFFEEMQPYEADDAIRDFIQYCKDNGVNIAVDSLNIGTPTTSTLGVSFFSEPEVSYDLKTYATQGRETPEEVLEAQARDALLKSSLASTQTVGAIDVSFQVTTLTREEMLKFVDIVNNYQKKEDGGTVRKAIYLASGLSVTYDEVQEKYDKLVEELTTKASADAATQLQKDTGEKVKTNNEGNNTDNPANGDEEEEKNATFDENTYQLSVTLTMYSIERMEDPTDQLAAQDAQVVQ